MSAIVLPARVYIIFIVLFLCMTGRRRARVMRYKFRFLREWLIKWSDDVWYVTSEANNPAHAYNNGSLPRVTCDRMTSSVGLARHWLLLLRLPTVITGNRYHVYGYCTRVGRNLNINRGHDDGDNIILPV